MTPGEVTSSVLKDSALGPALHDKFLSSLKDEIFLLLDSTNELVRPKYKTSYNS